MACRSQLAVRRAADLGFEAIELPVDARNPFVDLEAALDGGPTTSPPRWPPPAWRSPPCPTTRRASSSWGPTAWTPTACCGHPGGEGRLRRGPAGAFGGAGPAHRRAHGLCVHRVRGLLTLVPLAAGRQLRAHSGPFRDRLLPVLDAFDDRGVVLALQRHPRQFAYNLETHSSRWSWWTGIPHSVQLRPGQPAAGRDGPRGVRRRAQPPDPPRPRQGRTGRAPQRGRSGLLAHSAWDRPYRGSASGPALR